MKIGFDISPLIGGHAGRGTGTYTRNLLKSLEKESHASNIIQFSKQIPPQADIIHYPYFDPFFLTLSFRQPKPFVVTVHDLIPLVHKEHFPVGLRGELKWNIQRRLVVRAKAIITDSFSSKKDIVDILQYPDERVHVIYLAPGKEFSPQNKEDIHAVMKKYKLPKTYVLYVGDINWNKNIPTLIQAVAHINVPLVLVGKAFLDETLSEMKEIHETMNKTNSNDLIYKLGYVSDNELAALYSGAAVCVQVSLAEGFGLPVLESMACGTTVVVSSRSSLAEIAGPSIVINPDDYMSIASGIKEALKRPVAKHLLTAWASKYSWKETAKQTLEVYSNVLS